jgi:hypothetical protein
VPRKKLPSRDKAKEFFWRKAVQRHRDSGLTQAAFCQKEGLNQNNFCWWKRELARRDIEQASELPNSTQDLFVPLNVVAPAAAETNTPIAELDLAAGVVRIFAGIDRHALREIIAVLKEVTK